MGGTVSISNITIIFSHESIISNATKNVQSIVFVADSLKLNVTTANSVEMFTFVLAVSGSNRLLIGLQFERQILQEEQIHRKETNDVRA